MSIEPRHRMEAEVSAAIPTPLAVAIIMCADNIDRLESRKGFAGHYNAGFADGVMFALRMMEAGKILGPLPPEIDET